MNSYEKLWLWFWIMLFTATITLIVCCTIYNVHQLDIDAARPVEVRK